MPASELTYLNDGGEHSIALSGLTEYEGFLSRRLRLNPLRGRLQELSTVNVILTVDRTVFTAMEMTSIAGEGNEVNQTSV